MERQLAGDYEATVERALKAMTLANVKDIEALVVLHERIRGYGHVKLANLSMVKRRERELTGKIGVEAATGPYVQAALDELKGAGALKGIPVVVAK